LKTYYGCEKMIKGYNLQGKIEIVRSIEFMNPIILVMNIPNQLSRRQGWMNRFFGINDTFHLFCFVFLHEREIFHRSTTLQLKESRRNEMIEQFVMISCYYFTIVNIIG